MIDLLSALVANGTAYGGWGYIPWLPFDNFIPIVILAATLFWFITRNRLLSVMFFVSEYSSLIPTYLFWWGWDLDPNRVFWVWAVNVAVIWRAQVWLWDRLSRAEEKKKEETKNAC